MSDNIQLTENAYLASGDSRLIYQHPSNPDWLIKVIKKDYQFEKLRFRQLKILCPFFLSRLYYYETREYIKNQLYRPETTQYFEEVIGFCKTNLGFGLIVKAEKSNTGELAKSLFYLLKHQLITEDMIVELHQFLKQIYESPVIIGSLNRCNIVYSCNKDLQQGRFVLIDGFGDKTFIPYLSLFPFLNSYFKRRKIKRLLQKLPEDLQNKLYSKGRIFLVQRGRDYRVNDGI